MPELHIPFVSGQHEEIDEQILPDGQLRAVQELVMTRKGRLEHRKDYTGTASTTVYDSISNENWALNEFGDQKLLSVDRPPRLVWTRSGTAWESTYEDIDLPAFNALQRQTIPHALGYTSVDVQQTDIATSNGITVVTWQLGTSAHGWAILDEATQSVLHTGYTTGKYPKLTVGESGIILLTVVSAIDTIVTRTLNPFSQFPRFANTATVGTVHSSTRAQCYAVCPAGGTNDFIIAYHQSGNDPTVVRVQYHEEASLSAASGTPLRSQDITVHSGSTNAAVCLDVSCNTSFQCYVAWTLTTVKEAGFSYGDGDITASFSNSSTTQSDTDINGQVGVTHNGASSAIMVWSTVEDSSERIASIQSATIQNDGTFAETNSHYGLFPVSKPFVSSSIPYVFATRYTNTAPSGTPEFTTSYYLVRLPYLGRNDPTLYVQGYCGREVATVNFNDGTGGWALNNVATDGNGNYLWSGSIIAINPASVITRTTPNTSQNVQVGTALWRFSTETRDKHHMVKLGKGGYLTGGVMTRWNGAMLTQAGFLVRPDIIKTVDTASGSLGTGDYYYAVTYESVQNDGEIVRSEPSVPFTSAFTSSLGSATLTIRDDPTRAQPATPDTGVTKTRYAVYRTAENVPGTYYQVHDQDALGQGGAITATTHPVYVDGAADADITSNIRLYSDGSLSPVHCTPPPCRFLARVGDRLVAGGTEIPEEVWFSQRHVAGEQVNWADDSAYKLMLPEACTAVGELDGYPVLFTENHIFTVSGAGPDQNGNGLYELRQLPSEFGAITHFVATCDEGLCFQSKRGIELLRRGFGPPQWIGGPVADTLGTDTITSAVVVDHDKTVRFTCSSGVLVWNTTWNFWSVFLLGDIKCASSWGGYHVYAQDQFSTQRPQVESSTAITTDDDLPLWETGDIHLGSISGFFRARKLVLRVRWKGPESLYVKAEVSHDGGQTWPAGESTTWLLHEDDYSVDDVIPLSLHLRSQKGGTIRFRISEVQYSEEVGETVFYNGAVDFIGATLEYKKRSKTERIPVANRR